MSFLSEQPIRRQLAAAVCLLVVPMIVAVLWSARRTAEERQSEISEQATSVAATAAAYLEQYFAGLDAMASAIVRNPSVMALDTEHSNALFAELLQDQPLIINILLSAPDGSVRGSGLPVQNVTPDVRRQSFRDEVVKTGKPQVSDLLTGQLSGKPTVVLAYPVRDAQAEVVGVLGLGINLLQLETVFKRLPLPEESILTLEDRTGRVLARNVEAEQYIGKLAEQNEPYVSGVLRSFVLVALDHADLVTATTVVQRGPWKLTVGIPTAVVAKRLAPLWRRNLAIFVGVVGAVVLAGMLIAWQTNVQVGRLRSIAQRIAAGDLSTPRHTSAPNLELRELQGAFSTMAVKLREARDAIARQVDNERRMNESLHSLQRQVVRQERLAAVGVLVSGVAHELNNPLQGILGTVELLDQQPGFDEGVRADLAFLKTQSGRAREIIRNLSRFSSQQSGPPTLIDLRDIIAEVVQLRRGQLDGAGIDLTLDVKSRRKVYANFTEIEQVTLNFVINAEQSIESAGAKRGRIAIKVFDVDKKVRLEVHDNGPGVKPEDEPKLFQPFFTTKPVGKGTGLGLSVSYGIIDSYGGTIGQVGNEWGGATFFFELAAASTPDGTPLSADDRPAVLHGA